MKIVAVGDIGVDIYTNLQIEKPGGIGFNFAYNASENGASSALVSVIGNDGEGKKVKAMLQKTSIDHSHVHTISGVTPIQKIILKPSGERKFNGYNPGVLKTWQLSSEDISFIARHDVIFVPLSDGMKHIFKKIAHLQTNAIKVADFSQDSEYADFDNENNSIEMYSPYFDLIFVGATEKQKRLLENLSKKYPKKVFILTLGSKGSIGFLNGNQIFQPAEKIEKIVDTTGAGDAFQASFVVSYQKTKDMHFALSHGTKHSFLITQQVGSTQYSF